jgi:hypothetical protein
MGNCGGNPVLLGNWRARSSDVTPTQNTNNKCGGMPKANFVADVTISDGSPCAVGSVILKTWSMKNVGNSAWPAGVTLGFVGGQLCPITDAEMVSGGVPNCAPGETVNVSVKVKMPNEPGRCTGYYRLMTKEGHRFGQRVWVDCLVVPANQVSTPSTAPVVIIATPQVKTTTTPPAPEPKQVHITEAKTAPVQVQQPINVANLSLTSTTDKDEKPTKDSSAGKYAAQLRKLKNMGFKDEEMLTDLLIAAGGKEQQVIDWLVQPVV